MANPYRLRPLTLQEIAANDGFTHMATISSNDLTNATNGGTQLFSVGPIPIRSYGTVAEIRVKTPFEVAGTPANNTTSVTVGDDSAVNTYITTTEVNKNGAFIPVKRSAAVVGPYTVASNLKVTFTPMAATNLNALNRGELNILFKLVNIDNLTDLKQPAASTK